MAKWYSREEHARRLEEMLEHEKPLIGSKCPASADPNLCFSGGPEGSSKYILKWRNNPCSVCEKFVKLKERRCPCCVLGEFEALKATKKALADWRSKHAR